MSRLEAQLIGAALMCSLPAAYAGRAPSWVANIESASDGAGMAKDYEGWLFMAIHWFVPATNEYMEDFAGRDDDVTQRLLAVLTKFYAWERTTAYNGTMETWKPIGDAVRRLRKGSKGGPT